MVRRLLIIFILCITSPTWAANTIQLKAHHPDRYVVQSGDCLWDISGLFLIHRWQWRDFWRTDPQMKNPHLIYAGDVLGLSFFQGRPSLRVISTTKSPKKTPIPTFRVADLKPFFSQSMALEAEQINKAPYIVAQRGEHIIAGNNDVIYVRKLLDDLNSAYSIYRAGDPYIDPEKNCVLGYAAIHVADADLIQAGDPATLQLFNTTREVLIGDRLYPRYSTHTPMTFLPKAPQHDIHGQIIAVLDGVTQIGQFSIVTLNRGEVDGLEVGDILSIHQRGEVIKDTVTKGKANLVKLPDVYAGELIVFRTFDRVSFALVMQTKSPLHIYDLVSSPDGAETTL